MSGARIALVTGGMGGIGKAISRRLHRDGFTVVVGCSPASTRKNDWIGKQLEAGYHFHCVDCDIGDWDSTHKSFELVQANVGPIDVLVNNAGITRDATFRKLSLENWRAVIDTNLNGLFNTTKQVIEGMLERRWGRIINISSINGQRGQFGQTNYSAAKAGIHGFSMALAREVSGKGGDRQHRLPRLHRDRHDRLHPSRHPRRHDRRHPRRSPWPSRGNRLHRGLAGLRGIRLRHRCRLLGERRHEHAMTGREQGMDANKVVIVAATRTAIGGFQGALANIPAPRLGAVVIEGLLARAGLDGAVVDEVILGQVLAAGVGQNPARQAAIAAGLPVTTPALTLDKVCGSGLKAVHLAIQAIRCGDAEVVIAGGQENMSLSPYLLPGARSGLRMGHAQVLDSMIHDGLWDAFNDCHMGITAENLAEKYGLSREAQDAYAAESQRRAVAAVEAGRFKDEITPVAIPQRKGEAIVFDSDEQPRRDTTNESLARLRPVFKKDGTVTAGNAATLNDGAAAVLLMSERKAQSLGLPVLARIAGYASAGVDPAIMGIGPVPATRRCLDEAGWTLADLDLIEANEAFAVQALAVATELGWDLTKVNVNGGAIAVGHPIGASGCRVLVTLLHEIIRRDAKKGLATLCIGGGLGVALAIER